MLRTTLRRTFILFLGLGLSIPTGIILARVLSHDLGAEVYGLASVTISFVFWLELSTTQFFNRASIRFVSVADDWKAVGATFLRMQLTLSVVVAGITILIAPLVADLLRLPALRTLLPLLALDIPLYTLAQGQGAILVARGRVAARAVLQAVRWIGRLVLVIVFLFAGYGVEAPLRGYVAASLVEVCAGFILLRLPLTARAPLRIADFVGFALPILVYTVTLELFRDLDLLAIQALQPGSRAAGYYSGVQYLTTLPDLIAGSLSPILISMIAPQLKQGKRSEAARLIQATFGLLFLLLPFAALAAGSAEAIIPLVYAPDFSAAAPALTILILGALGAMITVSATAILTALNRPRWTGTLTALLLPLGFVGHALLVPTAGMIGAALITTSLLIICGLVFAVAACRESGARFPAEILIVSIIVAIPCFLISAVWSVTGWAVLTKLVLLSLIPGGCIAVGVVVQVRLQTAARQTA